MPPSLFAYLRPGHGKRNASSPASLSLSHEASLRESDGSEDDTPVIPFTTEAADHTAVGPPRLPPIPRVAISSESLGRQGGNTAPARSPSQPSSDVTSPILLGLEHVSPSTQPSTSDSGPSASTPDLLARTTHARSPSFLSPSDIVSAGYSSASRSVTSSTSLLSHRTLTSQTSLLSSRNGGHSSTPKMASTPTQAPQKSRKSMLRNPMSIFHRRRSGEVIENLSEDSLVSRRSPSITDNSDPSIRGRIVHDFSAPRPNRQRSYNEHTTDREPSPGRVSPQKIERQHTPVFRENFDDDTSYEQTQAAIRAEQLANSSFVARNSYHPPEPESSPSLPPMPQHSPPPAPQFASVQPPDVALDFETTLLSPVPEAPSPVDGSPEGTPRQSKSIKSPPRSRSRVTSGTENTFIPGVSLAHHPSSSSRFSFQIGGGDSAAQEKVLEERHREQAAKRKSKEADLPKTSLEDEYDMDDYDMDDGMEEDIPMLGEDDDFGAQSATSGMSAFDFSTLSAPAGTMGSMTPLGMSGQLQTAVDTNGNPIGFAISEDNRQKVLHGGEKTGSQQPEENASGEMDATFSQRPTLNDAMQFMDPNGLGLLQSATAPTNTLNTGLDDDLYFDDGIIDELGDVGESTFNEDIFDDPSGPLFDRKVKMPSTDDQAGALHSHPPEDSRPKPENETGGDDLGELPTGEVPLGRMPSLANQRPSGQSSNMEAFSSALTEALHKAEAEGRFTRNLSISTDHSANDNSSLLSNSRPSLIPDDSRVSQETTGFQPDDEMLGLGTGFVSDDYDYSDFDGLDDDTMIAEANAEALANDYEGFYGQEFGFYANAQGESWNAYGGYFGNPSSMGRTKSGRNAVVEPSLTPITERSEYSTRNSFVSNDHFRTSQLSLHSPGLAQLRMSPFGFSDDDADNMSLEALRKLRGKTFGSSSVSLGSTGAGSPRNSSPMGMQYVPRNASPMAHYPVFPSSDALITSGEEDLGGDEEFDADALDAVNAEPLHDDDGFDDDEDEAAAAAQDRGSRAESPTLMSSDFHALSSGISGIDLNTPSSPPVQMQSANTSIAGLGPPMLPASDPHFGITRAQQQRLALTSIATNLHTYPSLHTYPLPPPHPYDVLNSASSSAGASALNPIEENATPQPKSPPPIAFIPTSPPNSSLLSLPLPTAATTSTTSIPSSLASAPTSTSLTVSATTPAIPKFQSLGLIEPSPTSPTTTGPALSSGLGSGSGNGSKPSLHSRRSSGLVNSYVREADEAGDERWVLERRRTAESGEMELVGREVVEGGRI